GRRNGITGPAAEALATQLCARESDSITRNVLSFLRETEYDDPQVRACIRNIALDHTRNAQLRIDSINRLPATDDAILALFANDPEASVREHVFRILVKAQHRPTISRGLGRLT